MVKVQYTLSRINGQTGELGWRLKRKIWNSSASSLMTKPLKNMHSTHSLQHSSNTVVETLAGAFYPLTFQAEGVLSLPSSVRLAARPSVCKLFLVRTITRHKIELESSNFHQTCIMGYSWVVLKMEVIDLWASGSFWPFWLRILWNSACPRDNPS